MWNVQRSCHESDICKTCAEGLWSAYGIVYGVQLQHSAAFQCTVIQSSNCCAPVSGSSRGAVGSPDPAALPLEEAAGGGAGHVRAGEEDHR